MLNHCGAIEECEKALDLAIQYLAKAHADGFISECVVPYDLAQPRLKAARDRARSLVSECRESQRSQKIGGAQ